MNLDLNEKKNIKIKEIITENLYFCNWIEATLSKTY